jgi:hypothetical protein
VCLDNVVNTICGAIPVCTPVGTIPGESDCPTVTDVCSSHTPIGAPDAIGDTCEPPTP